MRSRNCYLALDLYQYHRPIAYCRQGGYMARLCCASALMIRGGVEDTRLEAKAKDTKKSEAKAKDSLSEDRHSRRQGQECSKPRPSTKKTSTSAIQKKKVFTKIFQAISKRKRFPKNFSSAPQNFNDSENSAVLEPRTGQFSRT